MGGKNHQPCKKYLPESTELSRAVSMAFAELELANVSLEDLILAELNGDEPASETILSRLDSSISALDAALSCLNRLVLRMNEQDYTDLPPTRSLNLSSVGRELAERNLVDEKAWARIVQLLKAGSFYSVVDHFRDRLKNLKSLTGLLVASIAEVVNTINPVSGVLENNLPGNFKPTFAVLYTAWAKFHQEFLASSLLSTEVWYAHNGAGSLCRREEPAVVA